MLHALRYHKNGTTRIKKNYSGSNEVCFTTYDNESQMKFLGLSNVEELVREQKKYAEGLSTHNRKFEYFQMLTLDESRVVGWFGYHTWYIDHNRAELGYGLFDETIKRQGLMSEALDYILPHGFNSMNLNRVEALT
jgi:ribosomal-protein-alanine N-acetyltransferase